MLFSLFIKVTNISKLINFVFNLWINRTNLLQYIRKNLVQTKSKKLKNEKFAQNKCLMIKNIPLSG